jgi:Putative Flp pilus-assembly TadE/G-like
MWRNTKKRRATVAPLVAVSLVAMIGVVAIAVDGGLLLDNHRRVWAAADASALAAADDLFRNYLVNKGADPAGTAKASALSTAAANGYSNDGVTSVVTVNIPPKSGNFVGKAGYAEVIIQFEQKRAFSSIFGSGDLPVKARAVACGHTGNIGILILDPHLQGALEIRGNVNLLNDGQLFSNSDNTTPNDAASQGATGSVFVGPGVTMTAGGVNVFNSLVNQGTVTYTNGGGVNRFSNRISDPLADIPEPTTSGLVNHGSVTVNSNTTLQPGVYKNITINSGSVTMAPGMYYIAQGGNVSLNSGSLQGTGVMIVNNTQQDSVFGWNNPAKGTINLTPPSDTTGGTWPTGTSSATYTGIGMWVPRTWNQEVHFQSDHNATVSGTWYAQGAEYDIRANGSSVVFNLGNYICALGEWNQKYGGGPTTGTGTININAGKAAPTLRPTLVE